MQQALDLAEAIVARGRACADEVEAYTVVQETALTRFARNRIHQNVGESSVELSVRLSLDGHVGAAVGNQADPDGIAALVQRATRAAKRAPRDPGWPGVARPSPVAQAEAWSEATATATPKTRAEVAAAVFAAMPAGALSFGGVLTGAGSHAAATSRGVALAQRRSWSELRLTVHSCDGRAGYAARAARDVMDLNPDALTDEALSRALAGHAVKDLPPGEYPVILAPYAVARLLEFLAFLGFAGVRQAQGRTFMHLGEPVTGPGVSIWDDGTEPEGLPIGFDREATPKRRVDLIRDGVAVAVLHDRRSAAEAGTAPTGHAAPEEAAPANLFFGPGSASPAELLAIDRGVWVTRLHYVNVRDPLSATVTGVTRDGTLLVESGRVVGPVQDMRFVSGILDGLRGLQAASTESRLLLHTITGSVSAPAIRLASFRFTGPSGR
ncbi:MAG TPA: metallopeptidase TldD-related protein [Streptosporangiaceae bacterium]|nr:metallopeptidase TldD-related protein [Streptosporangiaceae bacterium]